ncbi:Sulfate adenylyltransferase subunit 2 [Georgfuchsia toluolica]|uniref:Sulfate adenylyltransferase subunit 2 n=2 Tax=Georgfuchsia toluolica TaxID=424218 RepID=A0A916J3L8_9PROT|nr:Sulfate adenylyltransferase subunit 2 [Georgfuchsia toluolica]
MPSIDSRRLTTEVLNEKRREAVRLRQAGTPLAEVSRLTGLSAPTIISARKAFLAGGWEAVAVRARGRGVGEGRLISFEQEAAVFGQMVDHAPDKLGLPYSLWQVAAIKALIHQLTGTTLPERSITNYLKRWGLSVIKPFARLDAGSWPLKKWRKTIYPSIIERAQKEGAEIFWVDEIPLRSESLTADVLPHQRRCAVRAVTNRGKQMWLIYEGVLRAPILIEFLDRLQKTANGKAYVILEGAQWRRASSLSAWLAERHDHLLAFQLPDPVGTADVAAGPRQEQASGLAVRTLPLEHKQFDIFSSQIKHLITQSTVGCGSYDAKSPKEGLQSMTLTHLQRLEAESIHIMREVVAETENPVMLYSIGKDSAVMLHLAMKAFYPAKPPFPLLHVDTTWKFKAMYEHRDRMARELGMDLLVHINPEGLAKGINPFTHGSAIHTDIMKTEGLKQALEKYGFDAAFGGARRDEEKSRAKERIFSFRSSAHRWDPKAQRPELWKLYNARKHKGESIRVFPLSNWTELDIWQYIHLQNIPIVPLYFAKPRPVVERDGMLIMVDDERMPLREGEVPMMRKVRFRTLGCYPLSGAVESEAETLEEVIQEMLLTRTSERQGRMIDHDSAGSMEKKKQEGYF